MRLGNSRGQTSIEYILLLLIVVGVLVGGLYRFNGAFERFANNYFGYYLACLLETGELPSLGTGDAATAICDSEFEEFTLDGGRPPIEGSAGGTGGRSSSDKDESKKGSTNTSDTGEKLRGGEGGSGSGGSVPVGKFDPGFQSSEKSELAPRKVPVNKVDIGGGVTTATVGSGRVGFGGSGDEGRPDRVALSKDEKLTAKEKTKKAQAEDIEDAGEANSRIPAESQKDKSKDEPIEPFGFGDWFRILIIILIVIALVVFFGGQALQISKSQEK